MLFSKTLLTAVIQNCLDFGEDMCIYSILHNISHWGLQQHPLIKHINVSVTKYINI